MIRKLLTSVFTAPLQGGKFTGNNTCPAVLTFIFGTLLTVLVFANAYRTEANVFRTRFLRDADIRIIALNNYLDDQVRDLEALQRFAEEPGFRFNREIFRRLVRPLLESQGVQAIEWIPFVPAGRRTALEYAAAQEGMGTYRIQERAPNGTLRVAGQRDSFYPVYYVEPLLENEKVLGFDLGSEPVRHDALTVAERSGRPRVSARITLVQEQGIQNGFLVFVPVGRASAKFRGFVLGVYRADDMLKSALKTIPALGFDVDLLDMSAQPEAQQLSTQRSGFIYDAGVVDAVASLLFSLPEHAHTIDFAGRSWKLRLTASPAYRANSVSLMFLGIFPVGMLFTTLTATSIRRMGMNRDQLLVERQRLAGIIEGTNAGTWEWNIRTAQIECSGRSAEFIGYSPAELDPLSITRVRRLIHSDDRVSSLKLLKQYFQGDLTSFGHEIRLKHKDGSWVYVMVRGKITGRTPEGDPELMQGTVLNITRRKQAELLLEENHRFMRKLIDVLPGMVGYWTRDLRCTFANQAYLEWFGRTPAQMDGIHIKELMGNDLFTRDEPYIQGALQGMEQRFERTLSKADGSSGNTWANYIPDKAGDQVRGFFVVAVDITELRLAETELRKLSRAVMQSPVTVIITDSCGKIEFVNPQFTEVSGYSAEEVLGENPRVLKSDETPAKTHEELWATISAGKTWEGELRNKRKDGRLFWEHAKISAIHDEAGTITHYVAFKEDITEKKNVMAQLLHSQKMESIGELAGGLAHDLNNILSVVNGYAALAQIVVANDVKAVNYLNEITRASSSAALLTRSLLAYSRKQEMNQQNQNLNDLITVVGSFINRIIHDNIMFTISLQDDPLCVYIDTVQIEQVLLNLATNARDAMPSGGTFSISTAEGSVDEQYIDAHGYGAVGRYAIVTIRDSGHGMDEQTKNKVFDPFFTTKEVGKGTGLGLAMVMGIITQHDGFIDLQSEPGKGSVFKLYLPLVERGELIAETEERSLHIERTSGTILLAEDDTDTRSALVEFLTRSGFTVIPAVDGQDAVEKFAANKGAIDLVISDVVMPRKSGKAASDEIRQMSENMKFLFVSGHANEVIEREGNLGVDAEILVKPILPFDLLRKILDILDVPPAPAATSFGLK